MVKLLTAMTDGYAAYCILAVENEGKIHYAVPVKNCLYDAIQLAHQVTVTAFSHRKSQQDDRKPSGDEFLRYAMDYRVNLITPNGLSDSEIDEFQSNMREIMRYIKYSRDKKKLRNVVSTEQRFKCVERDAVEIINVATSSNMKVAEGKESVDVCIAIQGMMEDSEIKGAIIFAQKLGAQKEQVKRSIMEEYGKDDQEAEEFIKAYWK